MVSFRIQKLGSVSSTNDICSMAASGGDPGGLWLSATEQTQGRGRTGKQWSSVKGNLYTSLLLVDPCDIVHAAQISFVAALAVHETASRMIGKTFPDLALKWPNDVLLKGAKFSGILLEAKEIPQTRKLAVIIGFGINITAFPQNTPYPVTSLQQFRADIQIAEAQKTLMESFLKYLIIWNGGRFSINGPEKREPDFSAIRRLWLERAWGIGERAVIRLSAEETRSGILKGIDSFGRLELLCDDDRLERINAGDLFFKNLQSE